MNCFSRKRVWLADASLLAIVLGCGDANAVVFAGPESLQYIVPSTGYYDFTVAGADGGGEGLFDPGGAGAVVGGELFLDAGNILAIVVGGAGASRCVHNGYGGEEAAVALCLMVNCCLRQAAAAPIFSLGVRAQESGMAAFRPALPVTAVQGWCLRNWIRPSWQFLVFGRSGCAERIMAQRRQRSGWLFRDGASGRLRRWWWRRLQFRSGGVPLFVRDRPSPKSVRDCRRQSQRLGGERLRFDQLRRIHGSRRQMMVAGFSALGAMLIRRAWRQPVDSLFEKWLNAVCGRDLS